MERMDGSHERITGLWNDLCSDNSSCNYRCNVKGLFRGWFAKVNDQNANFSHSEKDVTDKLAIKWLLQVSGSWTATISFHGWPSHALDTA
jgi:hypothetical protein